MALDDGELPRPAVEARIKLKTNVANPAGAALPTSLADITPTWMSKVLGRNVVGVDPGNVIHGTALKGVFGIRYEDDRPGPLSVCVKGGLDSEGAAETTKMGLYIAEGHFYRDLLPELSVDVPDLIAVCIDDEEAQSVLVMEDLVRAGARFLRVTSDSLSATETSSLLTQLANLHARWWGKPPQEPWLHTGILPTSPIGRYFNSFTPDETAQYLKRRALGLPARDRDAARLIEAFWRLENRSGDGPLCVLHADPHIGNIFRRAGGRLGLCDWQTVMLGRWSHDVAYLMGSALDPATRAGDERHLLEGYLDELRALGVEAPTNHVAWHEYRQAMMYGLFAWLTNLAYFQPEEISALTADRFVVAVNELGSINILMDRRKS